jgi:hypothetical protein
VSSPSGDRVAGTVRWAIVPFAPAPPFRLYAGTGSPPIVVSDADVVIGAAKRGGDAELSYVVPGKARPVLLLTDVPAAHHREITALRLLRLTTLSADERRRVRAGEEELLFHLPPDRFELPEESAAIVSALVRVHVDALGSGPALGHLDGHDNRTLGERIITHYGFDTRLLIERRIHELVERRGRHARP